jgi:two-component sensor histidine kinase/putative methionine-R-sulfoxide reductase with GAF domain
MAESGDTGDQPLLRRLLDYQQVLGSFTRMASEPLTRERLLQHAAAQAARATHIKRAKVLRYRPEQGDLLVEAGVGWKPGVVGHATLGIDHRSPPGRSVQTAGPVAVEDLPNDCEYHHSDLLQEHGVVSLLNVPITIDGRTWGVLEIDTEKPTKFDQIDVEFLGTLANIIGSSIARHEAETKASDITAQAARQRGEAEIAMRELQHRTKNNLQIIVGLLSIKRRQVDGQEAREVIDSIIGRVEAVALAHDMLSKSETSSVEFAEYLRTLCSSIEPNQRGIRIEVAAEEAVIPLNRAVPAALVANELVTNSIKYAFANSDGMIRVIFETSPESGEAHLTVEDDGRGLPVPPTRGLGLKLVEAFARQIGGRVEYLDAERGTRIRLSFPVAF